MKPGVYRAKVTKHGPNDACFVVIPQVFLDTEVQLADYVGTVRPSVNSTGYVAYIAGDSAWPVWLGGADALFDSQQLEEEAAAAQAAANAAQSSADAAQVAADAAQGDVDAVDTRVTAVEGDYLSKSAGGDITGPVDISSTALSLGQNGAAVATVWAGSSISWPDSPSSANHLTNKSYVDARYNYGLASARPAASSAEGTMYYSTDTNVLEISDGTLWVEVHKNSPMPFDTSWNEISSFSGTWVNHSPGNYETAAYRMDEEGWVHLKGLIKDGGEGTTAFTLPADYIPEKTVYQVSQCGGTAAGYVAIRGQDSVAPGAVQPNWYTGGDATYHTLSGIQFPSHLAEVNRTRVASFLPRTGITESEYELSYFRRNNGMVVVFGIANVRAAGFGLDYPTGPFASDGAAMWPIQDASSATDSYLQVIRQPAGSAPGTSMVGADSSSYVMVSGEYGSQDIYDQWTVVESGDYLNSWGEYGGLNMWGPVAYYKDQYGFVHLRGLVNGGTINTDILSLPSTGYLPGDRQIFTTAAESFPGNACRVDVKNDGTVYGWNNDTTWTSLFGINYYAEG